MSDTDRSSGISSFPFQNPHNMGEKYFAHLEEVKHKIIEMKEEEEGRGPSGAALDGLVVLLNWTFLSAVVYIILNSTYLFGAAFRTPDASVQEVFWELVQITYGLVSHSSSSAKLSSNYILFRGLVYTSILLGFVVAFLIILGKSFMGYCPLDLTVSPRRNSRRRSSRLPPWFRRTLEILPSAFPLAQAVFSTAIVVTHHFAS